MVSNEISAKIAHYLLECEAVQLNVKNPFTWTSGLRSPVYCDNRVTLSYPHIRKFITRCLVDLIAKEFPGTQAITGVATAGIPQGTLIASEMNLPFAYIRPEPKKHGLKNSLEGRLDPGIKALVVEDLISTGKSSLKAVEDLRENNIEVLGLVSIFTYGFPETFEKFALAKCRNISLCDFKTLTTEAVKTGYLKADAQMGIEQWNADPQAWSDAFLTASKTDAK